MVPGENRAGACSLKCETDDCPSRFFCQPSTGRSLEIRFSREGSWFRGDLTAQTGSRGIAPKKSGRLNACPACPTLARNLVNHKGGAGGFACACRSSRLPPLERTAYSPRAAEERPFLEKCIGCMGVMRPNPSAMLLSL